jgi:hypothetical protein
LSIGFDLARVSRHIRSTSSTLKDHHRRHPDARMVAYDSRRTPDPAHMLTPDTLTALRQALEEQRDAESVPVPALVTAINLAAREARERNIAPETLLIHLKELANETRLVQSTRGFGRARDVREWMVRACLRAIYEPGDG